MYPNLVENRLPHLYPHDQRRPSLDYRPRPQAGPLFSQYPDLRQPPSALPYNRNPPYVPVGSGPYIRPEQFEGKIHRLEAR